MTLAEAALNLDDAKYLVEAVIEARGCDCVDACEHPRSYPWATRLDAERVLEWMNTHDHRADRDVAELEALVKT